MNNSSLAEQAVAMGPATVAPPSFDGQGWLVVINLAAFTFAFLLCAMLAVKWIGDIWRNRKRDTLDHPVTIWRGIGIALTLAGVLRFGIAAAVLWGWNPLDPVGTAAVLTLQRYVDPIAAALGIGGLATFFLSERGMVDQLRKEPFPLNMWASLPMLKRPAFLAVICLIAAIGVVSTR